MVESSVCSFVARQTGGHVREQQEDVAGDQIVMLAADRATGQSGRSYQEANAKPTFDTVPLHEARANSATGQRAALLRNTWDTSSS